VLTGRLPAAVVSVVDTTGAGDAFLAGFLYAMGALGGLAGLVGGADGGSALRTAVTFGAACGAATTTRPGAIDAQPTLGEAEEMAAAFAAQWKGA
jgi:fructokinase